MKLYRRILAFAVRVPRLFVELVGKKEKRALCILAVYFGVTDFVERLSRERGVPEVGENKNGGVWWVGDTGMREREGIRGFVGEEWWSLVRAVEGEVGLSV